MGDKYTKILEIRKTVPSHFTWLFLRNKIFNHVDLKNLTFKEISVENRMT